jgi:hypothetical protein
MKKLLNVMMLLGFSTMCILASDSGSQRFFSKSALGYANMMAEHPYLTGFGTYFIGSDIVRSMRGIAPKYYMQVTTGGNTWNYFRNGQLINSVTSPTTTRYLARSRNFGAMLLGYSFYKTYIDKHYGIIWKTDNQ